MTLPTNQPINTPDDDSDMFGPPRSSPVRNHQRPRVPMISAKLRQREERKRILQLCAHKLERIKDTEANLRRSVCINNTYSRLTDELRREKQSRYLANLPKSDTKPESAAVVNHIHQQKNDNDNRIISQKVQEYDENSIASHNLFYSTTTSAIELRSDQHSSYHQQCNNNNNNNNNINDSNNNENNNSNVNSNSNTNGDNSSIMNKLNSQSACSQSNSLIGLATTNMTMQNSSTTLSLNGTNCSSDNTNQQQYSQTVKKKQRLSSSSVDTDLEILDRELSAINASMPLIDPEITQGAEQLEKAISRKRLRTEEENDRLVREALSQFYLPTQRLISAIDDGPLDLKRSKLCNSTFVTSHHELDLDLSLDLNQNQKDFEVIMDALRLGTGSPNPASNDSCGQAAMMCETGVFHNLVVTSLET